MCYTMLKHSENDKIAVLSTYRLWFDVVTMMYAAVVYFVKFVPKSEAYQLAIFKLPIFFSF